MRRAGFEPPCFDRPPRHHTPRGVPRQHLNKSGAAYFRKAALMLNNEILKAQKKAAKENISAFDRYHDIKQLQEQIAEAMRRIHTLEHKGRDE